MGLEGSKKEKKERAELKKEIEPAKPGWVKKGTNVAEKEIKDGVDIAALGADKDLERAAKYPEGKYGPKSKAEGKMRKVVLEATSPRLTYDKKKPTTQCPAPEMNLKEEKEEKEKEKAVIGGKQEEDEEKEKEK